MDFHVLDKKRTAELIFRVCSFNEKIWCGTGIVLKWQLEVRSGPVCRTHTTGSELHPWKEAILEIVEGWVLQAYATVPHKCRLTKEVNPDIVWDWVLPGHIPVPDKRRQT